MDRFRECDFLMAHCAEIVNGIVVRVVVISNDNEPNVEQFAMDLFVLNYSSTQVLNL